jgi:hypothetical protein
VCVGGGGGGDTLIHQGLDKCLLDSANCFRIYRQIVYDKSRKIFVCPKKLLCVRKNFGDYPPRSPTIWGGGKY